MSSLQDQKAVLIVGGYGIVGTQIASILRQRHPKIRLIIAGRDANKAKQFAETLGYAEGVAMDATKVSQISPLHGKLAAVVTATNDLNNYVLLDTIANHIPYIDVTRWTAQLKQAIVRIASENITQPVILSSAWMAGTAALLAKKVSQQFSIVDTLDIDILFSLKDKAGPNSIDYIDQLGTPYDVFDGGNIRTVKPMTEPKYVDFDSGLSTNTFRFDTPDQLTLPISSSANSVSARIAYDDKYSAGLLSFLVRSGLWRIINRPLFKKFRHSLLYNPGEGGPHEVLVTVIGKGTDGSPKTVRATLLDDQGQTHLTALGGVIQIERALSIAGNSGIHSGVTFPERHEDVDIALATLQEHGVRVSIEG
ncbi:MAG: saccharopine dehydrogenase-like NADP-dependent oxidoreductase [Arenicella sp.]|jgi:saccharopine dehydrogenase-like NADP-dependent oxidoreductase